MSYYPPPPPPGPYPYPPPPPPLPGMYVPPGAYRGPQPPERSAVPRVIGILAIVFSCIGVLMALVMHFGPMTDIDRWGIKAEISGLVTWMWITLLFSIGLFILHLMAGIMAVSYRPSAPKLVTAYSVAALALILLDIILMFVLIPDNVSGDYYGWDYRSPRSRVVESLVTPRIVIDAMAAVWPIVALILINGRRAKQACGPT